MTRLVDWFFAALGLFAMGALFFVPVLAAKGCVDRSNSEHGRGVRKKESAEWVRECVMHRESYDRHEDCAVDAAKLFPGAR